VTWPLAAVLIACIGFAAYLLYLVSKNR